MLRLPWMLFPRAPSQYKDCLPINMDSIINGFHHQCYSGNPYIGKTVPIYLDHANFTNSLWHPDSSLVKIIFVLFIMMTLSGQTLTYIKSGYINMYHFHHLYRWCLFSIPWPSPLNQPPMNYGNGLSMHWPWEWDIIFRAKVMSSINSD